MEEVTLQMETRCSKCRRVLNKGEQAFKTHGVDEAKRWHAWRKRKEAPRKKGEDKKTYCGECVRQMYIETKDGDDEAGWYWQEGTSGVWVLYEVDVQG